MSTQASPDPWSSSFRSPSPTSDDDNIGDVPLYSHTLSRDAQLAADLNLNSREDRAIFKETPFTLASSRGKKSLPPSSHPDGCLAGVRAREEEKKKARGKNIEDEPWRAARSNDPSSWWKRKNSVWTDAHGNPVASEKGAPTKKQKTVLERVDEVIEKKPRGKKKTSKETQMDNVKKKKKDEVVKFGMLPKDAKPNDDFPVLQGLERQQKLPLKTKVTKPSITRHISTDSTSSLPPLNLDELIQGPTKSTQLKKTKHTFKPSRAKPSPDDNDSDVPEEVNKKLTASKYFDALQKPKRLNSDLQMTSQLPSLRHSGLTDPSQNIQTPPDTFYSLHNTHVEQPSTITHLSHDLKLNTSSSSEVPYSSPLAYKNRSQEIICPLPVKVGHMHRLSNYDDGPDFSRNQAQDKPTADYEDRHVQNQLQFPSVRKRANVNFGKQEDDDPYNHPAFRTEELFDTLRPKKVMKSHNDTSTHRYPNSQQNDTFRNPVRSNKFIPPLSTSVTNKPNVNVPTVKPLSAYKAKITFFTPSALNGEEDETAHSPVHARQMNRGYERSTQPNHHRGGVDNDLQLSPLVQGNSMRRMEMDDDNYGTDIKMRSHQNDLDMDGNPKRYVSKEEPKIYSMTRVGNYQGKTSLDRGTNNTSKHNDHHYPTKPAYASPDWKDQWRTQASTSTYVPEDSQFQKRQERLGKYQLPPVRLSMEQGTGRAFGW
ncbi:hypothetical protein M231_02337 [Tremella mesenterica]|uniref:Uncharacterized protein n=1 Tax=Tremella mesenterica TaxID=5217 RepID=A0A4Q1BQX7_TREME|nr:uncharacterized protein TREMEDRAFT_65279 [Tremella mesenterica DSM 1558]EIW66427.1 hypothetical protein TREMEDRAFT_65279 [Tremella mesenterica DSM 1558]RXK40354.1 hypothetical protein M231_02337 [Tremella mesenterica]